MFRCLSLHLQKSKLMTTQSYSYQDDFDSLGEPTTIVSRDAAAGTRHESAAGAAAAVKSSSRGRDVRRDEHDEAGVDTENDDTLEDTLTRESSDGGRYGTVGLKGGARLSF